MGTPSYVISSKQIFKGPNIKIDDRSKPEIVSDVIQCARKRGLTCQITRMETGDFVSKNCLFEHKHLPDLIGSLTDGRLYSQMNRMCEMAKTTNQYVGLFIDDGTPEQQKRADYSQVNWDSVLGSLGSVYTRYGVNIVWVKDIHTCAYIMVKTIDSIDSGQLGVSKFNVARLRKQTIATGSMSPQMKVLTRGFGLPVKTAEALLRKFGDICTISQQSASMLRCALGVGPCTANDIYNTLHRKGVS